MNKYKAIRIAAAFVFVCAVISWGYVKLQYADAELSYKELEKRVIAADGEDSAKETENGESGREKLLEIDHEALKKENHDYIGWLYACGGRISYPIVQTGSNDIYLHRTFFGDKSFVGSIFADYRASGDFTDFQTVLYGHSMKDGTMFRMLVPYTDRAYAEQYPYFYIYTENGVNKYEIFAVCLEDGGKVISAYGEADEDERRAVLGGIAESRLYDVGSKEPTDVDGIVSLVTCDVRDDSKRVVVNGVKIN